MKLSSREKILLTVTLTFALLVAYYFLVFQKLQEKISALEVEVETSRQVYEANEMLLLRAANVEPEMNKLKKEIYPVAKHYYGTTEQEEFIAEIDKVNKKSGMNITSIKFSPDTPVNLREPAVDPDAPAPTEETTTETDENTDSEEGKKENKNLQLIALEEGQDVDLNAPEYTGYSQNIKLMQTDIEFLATYSQIHKWLKAVDRNKRNIISSQLSLERKNMEILNGDKNPMLKGTVRLSFYQVIDADKYTKPIISFLKKKPLKKTKYINPFRSYPWAWKTIVSGNEGEWSSNNGGNIGGSGGYTSNDFGNFGNNNTGTVKPKNRKLVNRNLYDFEDGILPLKKDYPDTVASSEVETNQVAKGKAALKVNYSLLRGDLKDKVMVDLTEKNLILKEKMEMIRLKVYAEKENYNEVGLLLQDSSGQKYQVVLAKEVSWTGWKELQYDFRGISQYPVQVIAIYISYGESKYTNTGSLIFDDMNITYFK